MKISSANIDCDLYDGYKTVLPYVYDHLSVPVLYILMNIIHLNIQEQKLHVMNFFAERNIKPFKNNTREGEFERWAITKYNN